MEIFPQIQARLLFLTIITGICSGTLFDLLTQVTGVLKKHFRRTAAIARAIGDFLLAVATGAIIIILSYYFNKGELRFFCIFGLGVGFLLYFGVLSYAVRPVEKFIFRIFYCILRLIFRPICKIFEFFQRNLQNILYYTAKALAKKTILVYNICIKRSIVKRAKKGFLDKRFK